ncbi:hypothetical protein MNBD_BACTEROID07-1014, partial [hydrothermal vent metagenome]
MRTTKQMKTLSLLAAIILLGFSACKKSPPQPAAK